MEKQKINGSYVKECVIRRNDGKWFFSIKLENGETIQDDFKSGYKDKDICKWNMFRKLNGR